MKITICGSIAFYQEMVDVKNQLERAGFEVKLPPSKILDEHGEEITVQAYYDLRKAETNNDGWIWERKNEAMINHFNKVEWAEAVLVLNYTKNDIENYVGANTLLEMGVAMYLKKPIYLLNAIPEISCKEEIIGMKPIVIDGNLSLIKKEVYV